MSVEKQIAEVDTITVKFAGDSGDGIQLTGDQFGNSQLQLLEMILLHFLTFHLKSEPH